MPPRFSLNINLTLGVNALKSVLESLKSLDISSATASRVQGGIVDLRLAHTFSHEDSSKRTRNEKKIQSLQLRGFKVW